MSNQLCPEHGFKKTEGCCDTRAPEGPKPPRLKYKLEEDLARESIKYVLEPSAGSRIGLVGRVRSIVDSVDGEGSFLHHFSYMMPNRQELEVGDVLAFDSLAGLWDVLKKGERGFTPVGDYTNVFIKKRQQRQPWGFPEWKSRTISSGHHFKVVGTMSNPLPADVWCPRDCWWKKEKP